ncbi:hypothetical protein Pmar_PMAR028181 [Perkinsus marinus ATCC 50983]|uniref:Cyclin N-terminal domain-containing protein n=1 Tax=Perkinsus marinus (strain ATCC 50983 / TXsc) TaxID=423536 RepID=C5LB65_PERM5|nr:hypothetical protein Pmar_PMAR028181 [Perkinsus marinus ATCC 50983]EER05993.1 hypothetical protein Pmar_PMAR028181 [Perkinsus marinus ATCC 50983]|eukprot:XP_002774177.1 hypothetical protein Pmar_PMAR028181 [Perkinsus marinus ATCC 50983]
MFVNVDSPPKRPPGAPSEECDTLAQTHRPQCSQERQDSPDTSLLSRAPIVMCGGGLSVLGGLVPLSAGSCGSHSPVTGGGEYSSSPVISPHGPPGFASSQQSTCSSSETYKGLLLFSPDALRVASPSRKDKVTDATEDRAVVRHADFVDKVCQRVWTDYCIPANRNGIGPDDFAEIRATAMWYCHLFYAVHSLKRYGWRPVVLAATFLAFKSCERSPIRLRMNQLLDCYEKLERQSRYTSQRALQKMAQDVCEMEEAIMCLTGFEFDLNLPHKHVGSIVKSITGDGELRKRLQQKAVAFLNEAFRGRSVLFYPGDVLAFAAVSEAAAAVLERDSASAVDIRRKLFRPGFDVAAVVAAMHSHEHPVARRRRADSSSSVSGNQSGSSVAACSPSAAVEGTSLKFGSQASTAAISTPMKRKRFDEEPSSEPSTLTALDLALSREMPPAQCTRAAIARRRMLLMGGEAAGNTRGENVRDSGIVLRDIPLTAPAAPRKRGSRSSSTVNVVEAGENGCIRASPSTSPTKRHRITVI